MSDVSFDALEAACRAKKNDEQSSKMMSTARSRLVLGRDAKAVFFATLVLKMKMIPERAAAVVKQLEESEYAPDRGVATLATDGKNVFYNPDFVIDLTMNELMAVLAHEATHVVAKHHTRQGWRDARLWNVACDLAINPILRQAGFDLPKAGLFPGEGRFADPKYAGIKEGMDAESIYPHLLQPPKQKDPQQGDGQGPGGQGQGGQGQDPGQPGDDPGDDQGGDTFGPPGTDPGGCGSMRTPGDGSPAALAQAEAEAGVAAASAAQACKARGNLPGGLGRLVDEALTPKVDGWEVLRRFVTTKSKEDYKWSPPNRRFVHRGLYLPSLASDALGHIYVHVDTSGSIGSRELTVMGRNLEGILALYQKVQLTIIYCDAKVQHIQEWQPEDGPLVLKAKGGGGTSHKPVWDWMSENGQDAVCLVSFTDLYSDVTAEDEPEYPVLFAVVGNDGAEAPFGEVVQVDCVD